MTRIVAGAAGGRRIDVPPKGTRPTSDRVREALFSAVEAAIDLDGARVLDLYAGSGALGFEALSRGAGLAVFVEENRAAVAVLRRNAEQLGLPGARIVPGRVEAHLAGGGEPFDLVLADPPYAADVDPALRALVAGGWTAPGTLVVVERDRRSGEPAWPQPLAALRSKRYGDTELHWAEHLQ